MPLEFVDKPKLLGGLTLNIVVLGIVSFLTDVSSEMVFALLPFFMVSVLGIGMTFVGLIEGAAESTASILKVFSGWFSDKIGKRKPLVAVGYSVSTVSKPFFAFATLPVHVFIIRIMDRVGKGIRTSPRDALVADSVDARVRGKAYGLHRSMDTLGAVIGPLLAFLLFPLAWYTGVFLLSVVPAAAAVILLLILVKEKGRVKSADNVPSVRFQFKSLNREFKIFLFVVTIFTLSNFSYAFFLLRARDLGIPAQYAPLLYLIFNLVYALCALPVGMLADEIGKKPVMALGYVAFGITCLGFAYASQPLHAVILFIAYGIFFAITDTVQRAIVPDLVTSEFRGTAFGMLHTAIGLAAFPASFIAGTLWQLFGSTTPFMLGAIISFISTVLFLTFIPEKGIQIESAKNR